jgi:hypothetical protein
MLKNFKKGFNGDYGIKLTPNKLRTLCELDWPVFGVGWPLEGAINKIVVNEVYKVIVGKLANGHITIPESLAPMFVKQFHKGTHSG